MTLSFITITLPLLLLLLLTCCPSVQQRRGSNKDASPTTTISSVGLLRPTTVLAGDDASSSGGVVDFDASHRQHPAVIESGDIIFGGLFPVHDKGEGKPCGALNAETGFQRLLAMLYAVEKLNRDDLVLPGIKIGIHSHDTCQNDIYAMERVLEFIAMRSRSLRGTLDVDESSTNNPHAFGNAGVHYSNYLTNYNHLANLAGSSQQSSLPLTYSSSLYQPPPPPSAPSSSSNYASSTVSTQIVRGPMTALRKPIVAVIGPAQSSITTAVASVLRLFQIPQISYAATSTELSDRTRFDYFFRVVPPDNLQAEVMAAVVHSLKWRYVWAVGDEGPYGYKGVKSFAEAIDHNVCIGQEFFIPRNAKDKYFDDLVDRLASNERARGVVLFCNEANIRRLLQATVRRGRTNQFYWLASDSWGAKQRLVQGLEEVADGAITILPQKEVVQDFDVFMKSLQFRCNDAKMAARNPWLQEYWEQLNNCSCRGSGPNFRKCPDSGNVLVRNYRQEGLIQFVIDSVYALAHALRNIQRVYCGENYIGLCSNMKRVIYNGTLVRDFIQNVTFFGISKTHIAFNSEGGVEGKYEVYQFRWRQNGSYEYVKTGWWNPKDGLALHQPHIRGTVQTFCARGSLDDPLPVSYCSDQCPADQGYEYTTDSHCCWHCERCHKNQYLNFSSRECNECPEDELQSSSRVDQCEKIRFVHIDWDTIWPCIPICLAALGLVANAFILYTLIKYNKTAIIKASGRESSVILLTGLTCTFATIMLQPLWPSFISCTIMRLGMPVSLTMCYASIFTKTHRIYRIFMPSLNNLIHRPPFISPKSQIIMSLLCTGVSLLLSIVCLTLEPPEVEYLTHNLPETVVRCRIKNTTFFLTFIYDILVIMATTSLAWQVRNIPENFNEAKYIAFLMYSSCVVWVGLLPIYFLMTSNYTVQMTSFLLCIVISAIDIQLCMFLPKMYVVYTGNEDPLHRSQRGKFKFSYAAASRAAGNARQHDGTVANNRRNMLLQASVDQQSGAVNHAALAVALLKAAPNSADSAHRKTGSPTLLTTPTVESFSAPATGATNPQTTTPPPVPPPSATVSHNAHPDIIYHNQYDSEKCLANNSNEKSMLNTPSYYGDSLDVNHKRSHSERRPSAASRGSSGSHHRPYSSTRERRRNQAASSEDQQDVDGDGNVQNLASRRNSYIEPLDLRGISNMDLTGNVSPVATTPAKPPSSSKLNSRKVSVATQNSSNRTPIRQDDTVVSGMTAKTPPPTSAPSQKNRRASSRASFNPMALALGPIFSPIPARNNLLSSSAHGDDDDDDDDSDDEDEQAAALAEFYQEYIDDLEHPHDSHQKSLDRSQAKVLAKALSIRRFAAGQQQKSVQLPVKNTLLKLSHETAMMSYSSPKPAGYVYPTVTAATAAAAPVQQPQQLSNSNPKRATNQKRYSMAQSSTLSHLSNHNAINHHNSQVAPMSAGLLNCLDQQQRHQVSRPLIGSLIGKYISSSVSTSSGNGLKTTTGADQQQQRPSPIVRRVTAGVANYYATSMSASPSTMTTATDNNNGSVKHLPTETSATDNNNKQQRRMFALATKKRSPLFQSIDDEHLISSLSSAATGPIVANGVHRLHNNNNNNNNNNSSKSELVGTTATTTMTTVLADSLSKV